MGNWTEQGDLRLILTYWRYLLHPHREPINSLVIDGRRAKHRLEKLRKQPAVAKFLPKKAPASLVELGPALEDFFKLVDGGDVRTKAATIEQVEGTSTPDGAPPLNAGVASARSRGVSSRCCGAAPKPAAAVASSRPASTRLLCGRRPGLRRSAGGGRRVRAAARGFAGSCSFWD